MTARLTPERYAVEFVVLRDSNRPGVTRLRQLLKFALRALRLRCVVVKQIDSKQETTGKVNP